MAYRLPSYKPVKKQAKQKKRNPYGLYGRKRRPRVSPPLTLAALSRLEKRLMAKLVDVTDKIAAIETKMTAQTDVTQSIQTLLEGLSALVASLKQQLADAIAGGSDPAALQAVLDSLTTVETEVAANTQKLADAATANTPAADGAAKSKKH